MTAFVIYSDYCILVRFTVRVLKLPDVVHILAIQLLHLCKPEKDELTDVSIERVDIVYALRFAQMVHLNPNSLKDISVDETPCDYFVEVDVWEHHILRRINFNFNIPCVHHKLLELYEDIIVKDFDKKLLQLSLIILNDVHAFTNMTVSVDTTVLSLACLCFGCVMLQNSDLKFNIDNINANTSEINRVCDVIGQMLQKHRHKIKLK